MAAPASSSSWWARLPPSTAPTIELFLAARFLQAFSVAGLRALAAMARDTVRARPGRQQESAGHHHGHSSDADGRADESGGVLDQLYGWHSTLQLIFAFGVGQPSSWSCSTSARQPRQRTSSLYGADQGLSGTLTRAASGAIRCSAALASVPISPSWAADLSWLAKSWGFDPLIRPLFRAAVGRLPASAISSPGAMRVMSASIA